MSADAHVTLAALKMALDHDGWLNDPDYPEVAEAWAAVAELVGRVADAEKALREIASLHGVRRDLNDAKVIASAALSLSPGAVQAGEQP